MLLSAERRTEEVAEMSDDKTHKFAVGDIVRILSIPDWLVGDLPESERAGILACVGKEIEISEIDSRGGIWVGFGETVDEEDSATYRGQSFVIEPDRIQLVRAIAR
jgi:hypothetical protein